MPMSSSPSWASPVSLKAKRCRSASRDSSAEIAPASILPQPEEDLVEAVAATGKPLAVVLMNGSALAVNWINEHANAVLEAWYPGEEGGAAVAETLSGKNNPAGRLPVTFYNGVNQLPNFEDYGMANRTYRYFNGKPLYPFGYGLSYTKFSYSDLSVPAQAVAAGQPVGADVTVTNTGKVAGDEVVQLYLKFPAVKGAPRIALRGFQRIHLEPGASQKVHFDLKAARSGHGDRGWQSDHRARRLHHQHRRRPARHWRRPASPATSTLTANMHCPNKQRREIHV